MEKLSAGSPALLSELIGLIYEAASDISLWPRLLEGMAEYLAVGGGSVRPVDVHHLVAGWFGDAGMPSTVSIAEPERSLFASLAPHFVRGHQLHQRLAEAEDERNLLESVMDRLPLGMAFVDENGSAISMNRPLLSLVRSNRHLRLYAGRLVSLPEGALAVALRRVVSGISCDEPLRLGGSPEEGGLSLWVSRLALPAQAGVAGGRAVVLAASQSTRALSEAGLCALFCLTPAEARLTQQLALGRTLDEAVRVQGITLNTGKSHLKRVFAKVGVRRQPELLQAVYASPLWLDIGAGGPRTTLPPEATTILPQGMPEDGGMRLPDGRWLAWSDSGDPQGLPVVFMHGIAGSRHLRHPDDSLLLELGIRLIIPERPGSGDSDPLAGRQVADWPRDVAALADNLGLGRFAVLGYSAGTPYALVTARDLAGRVVALSIVAAMPPIDSLENLENYSPTFRMSLLVARHVPSLLPPLLRVMVNGIRGNVYRYMEQTLAEATESDKRVFADPRIRASYATGLLAGVRRGEQDLVLEVLLVAQGWEVEGGRPDLPTQFWHGEADPLVAPEGARKLAARLPSATFHTVPGAGHYVIYSHWREILQALGAAVAAVQ